MSDTKTQAEQADATPSPTAAPLMADPTAVLTQLRDILQGEAEVQRRRERDRIQTLLDTHDAKRAKLPKHTLVAVTAFTLVTDDEPEGVPVAMGQEFEVSEFDLPRYLGKGLPRANEVTESGVAISQV